MGKALLTTIPTALKPHCATSRSPAICYQHLSSAGYFCRLKGANNSHPVAADSLNRVNQVKNRLQTLGLLDRTFATATDEDITDLVGALDEDHMEALTELVGGEPDAVRVRDGVSRGRLDGTMEGIAIVLTDACLADCIEKLGAAADYPSTDDLNKVLPGIIERHGIPATRIMLAATIAGEAPAAAIIREILKSDETLGLPTVETSSVIPARHDDDSGDRDEIKARRKEAKAKKQAEARARREQAQRAKGR